MTNNENKLMTLETQVTMAVCNVFGVVCKAEIEELERLRKLVGKRYDAINGTWHDLEN